MSDGAAGVEHLAEGLGGFASVWLPPIRLFLVTRAVAVRQTYSYLGHSNIFQSKAWPSRSLQ